LLFLYMATAPSYLLALQQVTVEHFVGAEGGIGVRDGFGPEARFDYPRGVWSDGTFAYVADSGNSTIRRVTLKTGEVATMAGVPQHPQSRLLERPTHAWGNGAFLYFVDGVTVRRLDLKTSAISLVAGSFRGPLAITGNSTDVYILDSPVFDAPIGHG